MTIKNLAISATLATFIVIPTATLADTFSLWVRSDGSEFMPKLVEAFNAQGEHEARLQIVPVTEMVQKYGIAAAGGSAPDALSLDLIYVPSFANSGQLKDITEFSKSLPYFDSLSQAHLELGTLDNKIYGLPFSGDASVLLWNKDLYREAGLDPEAGPTTWAEIREHAEAINALGDETYGYYFSGNCGACQVFTFTPMIKASGSDIFADNGQTATLDTPVMRSAIEFYRNMVKDGLVPAGSQTDGGQNFFATFASGNIGISPIGSFAIGALNNQYPDLDFGVTFIPGQNGDWSSFAGGDNFVVSVGTEKMEAIEAFIELAYSLEGQKILATNGALPVRGDIAEDALEGLDSRYITSFKAMENGSTPYSIYFNDLINSRNGPWITTLNRAIFSDSAEEIQNILKDGEKEMQSIIDAAN